MRDNKKNNDYLEIIHDELEKQREKESKELRSPIYFDHIDNMVDKESVYNTDVSTFGFVNVPRQQDGFGNLSAQTHIGRVPSIFVPALEESSKFYQVSNGFYKMGYYTKEEDDLFCLGLDTLITSVFRKMSADIVSVVVSVFRNGFYNHIAPFYKGSDTILNKVGIENICRTQNYYTHAILERLMLAKNKEEYARFNATQALEQSKFRIGLLDNIASAYHELIISLLNNLYYEDRKNNTLFDMNGYIKYITSDKWGDCAKNENVVDNYYSFAYATMSTIARKDCEIIREAISLVIMNGYGYLSSCLFENGGTIAKVSLDQDKE